MTDAYSTTLAAMMALVSDPNTDPMARATAGRAVAHLLSLAQGSLSGQVQELFLPPSNPAQENWTGHVLTPAEGRKISGIDDIWDSRHLTPFLSTVLPQETVDKPPDVTFHQAIPSAPANDGQCWVLGEE